MKVEGCSRPVHSSLLVVPTLGSTTTVRPANSAMATCRRRAQAGSSEAKATSRRSSPTITESKRRSSTDRRRIATSQAEGDYSDFKTALQELTAHHGWGVPVYEVIGSGPDHQRVFNATVIVDGDAHGMGTAPSKKLAEQRAARMAYRALNGEHA